MEGKIGPKSVQTVHMNAACSVCSLLMIPDKITGWYSDKNGEVCIRASFCNMKGLGVFLLHPRWDASPSHGYP